MPAGNKWCINRLLVQQVAMQAAGFLRFLLVDEDSDLDTKQEGVRGRRCRFTEIPGPFCHRFGSMTGAGDWTGSEDFQGFKPVAGNPVGYHPLFQRYRCLSKTGDRTRDSQDANGDNAQRNNDLKQGKPPAIFAAVTRLP